MALALPAHAADTDCRPAGAEPAEIAAITPQATLRLRDGRELTLSHLLPPESTPEEDRETGSGKLRAWLAGQTMSWKPAGEPDRWGRIPANLFLQEPDRREPPFWLQAGLAQQGWAALWPGRMPAACLARLLAAERRAMAGARGHWAAEVQAGHLARLGSNPEGAIGQRMVIILRIRSVRSGRLGSFVNFVPSLHGSPSLFLTTRQMEAFRHAQRDPFSWQGKRVLLRFVVPVQGIGRIRIEGIDQLLPID
ncbi:MAG: hypothetical protein O9322_15265 [Beijerinckiaceae bacterium]|nr:hypothetical protein [Beijerinckiaceae bacterium]MCZ8300708.1 hypothetical protein [Beijerinckiaceae bacterium]